MRLAKLSRAIMASLLSLALTGCANRHLFFSTYTKVGVDVTVEGQIPRQAVFGYKRFEGAIIPVKVESGEPELASVYAGIRLSNTWTKGVQICQVFATGAAAASWASDPAFGVAKILGSKEGSECAVK